MYGSIGRWCIHIAVYDYYYYHLTEDDAVGPVGKSTRFDVEEEAQQTI